MEGSGEGRGQDSPGQELARGTKNQSITLADGNEYSLSPLNLNMLCEIEDRFGQSLEEVFGKPTMKILRFVLYLKLSPNHPHITEEEAGVLMDQDIMQNIGNILGIS